MGFSTERSRLVHSLITVNVHDSVKKIRKGKWKEREHIGIEKYIGI